MGDFSEGYATVKLNGKYGTIDLMGRTVVAIKYDDYLSFEGGLELVRVNDRWGMINEFGQEIIPLKYDYLRDLVIEEGKNGNVKVNIQAVKGKKEGEIEYKAVRRILGDVYFYSGWKPVKKLK